MLGWLGSFYSSSKSTSSVDAATPTSQNEQRESDASIHQSALSALRSVAPADLPSIDPSLLHQYPEQSTWDFFQPGNALPSQLDSTLKRMVKFGCSLQTRLEFRQYAQTLGWMYQEFSYLTETEDEADATRNTD